MVCQTGGILWRLSRSNFRAAVQRGRGDAARLLLGRLKDCEVLEPLTNGQLMVMADLMQPVSGGCLFWAVSYYQVVGFLLCFSLMFPYFIRGLG